MTTPLAVGRDPAAEKRTERALRIGRIYLNALVDSGIFIINNDGTVTVDTDAMNGPQGEQGESGTGVIELLALLQYAFERIQFLEAALKIKYKTGDILVPDEIELLDGIF